MNYKIEDMRVAADIVSKLLLHLKEMVRPGVNILDLEHFAESYIKTRKATAYNKGYQPKDAPVPFPTVLCVNINDEAVHCPARDYVIKEGDIVNIDVGVKYESACGDAAFTCIAGDFDQAKNNLLFGTITALENAERLIKPGINTNTLSKEIERTAKAFGLKPVKIYGGHRIGEEMHMEPFIANERGRYSEFLKEGMVICLEPILTPGNGKTKRDADWWTERSANGEPVAQFESMCLVTKDGYERLTTHL